MNKSLSIVYYQMFQLEVENNTAQMLRTKVIVDLFIKNGAIMLLIPPVLCSFYLLKDIIMNVSLPYRLVTKGTPLSKCFNRLGLGLRLGPHLVNGVSLHCAYLQRMFQLPENTGVIDQIK